MNSNISRRGFVAGSAAVAGMVALAGCSTASSGSSAVPSADKYPIDPDGSDVKAKWTSEEVRDGWTKATNPDDGPEIGAMDSSRIIQVDGLAFRDLNGNGKLDLWEDWRQSASDRAKALAETLEAEDCIKLMFHGGAASGDGAASVGGVEQNNVGLIAEGSRAGVSRLSSTQDSYASDIKWINTVQEACEKDNGIPYLNSSDPYTLFDIPSFVGMSAAMDKDLWRKAGMWTARAWHATGVRCNLGPQVDVYSSPIGCRLSGSVCEDPAVNRDFAQAYGGGMQSTWGDDDATDDKGWGKDSVGVMLKHFVGEGCAEGGRNDHMDGGKWNVFPGDNFNAHLIPFLDGGMHLDSKTEQMEAVMPCYGIASSDEEKYGENVGSAYNKRNISILRNAGWDGMICTDWMIMTSQIWGVGNLTEPERFKKLLDATVDQYGGGFEPEVGMTSYATLEGELGADAALARVRDSARRIFKFMIDVQLFEQPYTETAMAKAVFENDAASDFGQDSSDKCVIMLKNTDGVISKSGLSGKVYIPQKYSAGSANFMGQVSAASIGLSFGADVDDLPFDVVTDKVAGPTGAPAEGSDDPTPQESDITRLSASELEGVKYAIVGVKSPRDAYDGIEGGAGFGQSKADAAAPAVYKPVSLQYRPYTADGDEVRRQSLNTVDEYGVYENRSVYGQSTHATNETDLDFVISIKQALPADAKLILVVDVKNPMIFSEIEPYADVILMGFDSITESAFSRIISGKVEPSGLLPFQMPKDMVTVNKQYEDVPRDMDCYVDAAGNTYDFTFGLNWSGKIDDDRVKRYDVDPLTKPTTEVKADESK